MYSTKLCFIIIINVNDQHRLKCMGHAVSQYYHFLHFLSLKMKDLFCFAFKMSSGNFTRILASPLAFLHRKIYFVAALQQKMYQQHLGV